VDVLQRFHVNPADGTLVRDGYELRIGSPVCMVFARRQA